MMRLFSLALATLALNPTTTWANAPANKLIQYGNMHETLAMKKFAGRVVLADLLKKPNFFAVGALEGLMGEVTIIDGKVVATEVDSNGQAKPVEGPLEKRQATLLLGSYITEWSQIRITTDMSRPEFEAFITAAIAKSDLNPQEPIVFRVSGILNHARMHVIHGACPLHARMNKINLAKESQPYEHTLHKVDATVVAVFAKDAVGKITHPDTQIHAHLVHKVSAGQAITGHLEDFSVGSGASLWLPKNIPAKS